MDTNINAESLFVTVEFKEDAKNDFTTLKKKLRMENNNDVIRWAIAFANKRTK